MTEHNMNNYEETRSAFTWKRPEYFNFAGDVIDKWASQEPTNTAMLWTDDDGNDQQRTFTQVSHISKRLANVLTGTGVKPGDVVVAILGRNIEWWDIFTACLRMGAVISPGTTQLSPKDLKYRINAAQAVCVITDEDNAPKMDEIYNDCASLKARIIIDSERDGWINYADAMANADTEFETVNTRHDDDAMCYFTSGTTGYPKMCIHSHSYALGHETTGKYWLDLTKEDMHWNISDTGWAKAAWSSYFGPWLCGATLFIHSTKSFSATKTLELLQDYPITTMCGAPTIYRMLVMEDLNAYNFDTLRHAVGAGEPLNPEIIEVWKSATGVTIRDGYGQTETGILCASFPALEPRYGSMGKPAPGIDLNIIDNDGHVVLENIEGDIAIRIAPERPQGLFKEYKNDPEKTASTFKGDWYLTGDRAYRDEDGYFWFVSRADDVILSAGYRIGPFEVESALIEHPAVAESAVVSSPDETRGEVVKAFVVLTNDYQSSEELAQELKDHVKAVTAPYKYPRKLEFVKSLPKTVSGKIRRIELRDQEWGR